MPKEKKRLGKRTRHRPLATQILNSKNDGKLTQVSDPYNRDFSGDDSDPDGTEADASIPSRLSSRIISEAHAQQRELTNEKSSSGAVTASRVSRLQADDDELFEEEIAEADLDEGYEEMVRCMKL